MPRPLERRDLPEILRGGREVYCSCLFHGTHKVPMVSTDTYARMGPFTIKIGTEWSPVSEICGPDCGVQFITYTTGEGPDCTCLDNE